MDERTYFAVTRSVRAFTKKSLDILKQTALSIGSDAEQTCPTLSKISFQVFPLR
jgi:hypothetical protein